MKFQLGNYYQHSGGRVIHIIGTLNTFFYGNGLVSEDEEGNLSRVGDDEASAMNWHQVSGWPRSCYLGNSIPEPTEKPKSNPIHESNSKLDQ